MRAALLLSRLAAIVAFTSTLFACRVYNTIVVGDAARDGDAAFDVTCPSDQSACAGRCVSLATTPEHCGACGHACSSAGGRGLCADGACVVVCDEFHLDCDREAANGCEIDARSDATNCGVCGRSCASVSPDAACVNRACVRPCQIGTADCDGLDATGCETRIADNASNCGACGRVCGSVNTAASDCVAGVCVLTCSAGFADCDGDASNGCEANLATDPRNCTACRMACAPLQLCSNGCGMTCSGTTMMCGSGCADFRNDVRNCGSCGNVCPSGPHSAATCVGGVCGLTCDQGYANCDTMAANGCESARQYDPNNCGACGMVCPRPVENGTPFCDNGNCGGLCNMGFLNCDGPLGCETNGLTSSMNCGACGHACVGGQACVSGTCVCPNGTTLCNGTCVDTRSSSGNCGACGVACAANMACSNGACVATCAAGERLCGTSCVNVSISGTNCGACGNACTGGRVCASGTCACPAGSIPCGGVCTDTTSDYSNCGACGNSCLGDQYCFNSGCNCVEGTLCDNGGFAQCVDTNSDRTNCGHCGNLCFAGSYNCIGGECM